MFCLHSSAIARPARVRWLPLSAQRSAALTHWPQLLWRLGCIALLLCAATGVAQARDLKQAVGAVPNPRDSHSWVADPGRVIAARHAELDRMIEAYRASSGGEIAVVVLPSIGEFVPKEFATELFARFGIGQKGKDNGVLVLHVLDQRRIEIETGYGMEGVIPDIKAHWIVEDIALPFFRAGSFADGQREVVAGLIFLAEHPQATREQLRAVPSLTPGHVVDPAPVAFDLAGVERQLWDYDASSLFFMLAIGCAGLSALLVVLSWGLQLRRRKDLHARYDLVLRYPVLQYAAATAGLLFVLFWEWQALGSFWSLLLSIPQYWAVDRWRTQRLKHLRESPRRSPSSGKLMQRLKKGTSAKYLSPGQNAEQRLGAFEYDVWFVSPQELQVERYLGSKHDALRNCDKCGFRTERTSSRTLQGATETATGKGEWVTECAHCHAKSKSSFTIARETPASTQASAAYDAPASSYDSSSSSDDSSFGGGSSGGGGAGGSY